MKFTFDVKIAGQQLTSYSDLSLSYGIDQFARSGRIQMKRNQVGSVSGFPFIEGDGIKIELRRDGAPLGLLIDGYIDSIDMSYSDRTNNVSFGFRSKVADLVDSTAITDSRKWKKAPLIKIAKDILADYSGIEPAIVTTDPEALKNSAKPFDTFSLQDEETVFDALLRLAKARGLFLMSDENNQVLFATAGAIPSGLSFINAGGITNVKTGNKSSNFQDRYSEYRVYCQHAGSAVYSGATITSDNVAVETDEALSGRVRPLVICAESSDLKANLPARAKWERNVRAGKSVRLSYTINAPSEKFPALIRPNTLALVNDDTFELNGQYLIAGVNLSSSLSGQTAMIELAEPGAFTTKPTKKRSTRDTRNF